MLAHNGYSNTRWMDGRTDRWMNEWILKHIEVWKLVGDGEIDSHKSRQEGVEMVVRGKEGPER